MTFGENLKRIRKERGLTQAELGKLIGKSHATVARYEKEKGLSTIARYESNVICPSINMVQVIADVLGCTVGELFGEESKVVNEKVGRWESFHISYASEEWSIRCSNCKAISFYGMTPYCPMCGAKMERSLDNGRKE